MAFELQQGDFSDRLNFGWFLNTRELIGTAVEVGTHRGDFARRLMFTWLGEKLYCVDPYLPGYDGDDPASAGDRQLDLDYARSVLAPYKSRVEFVLRPSLEAAGALDNESLDFVYIDARHRSDSVRDDINCWWPKVRPGGVLAGHDFLERGGGWGREIQPPVTKFSETTGLPCYLVTEPSGAPWSWYFVKPARRRSAG